MAFTLEDSYRQCAKLARKSASSFYYSFWLLPAPKRRAMCALYAFARRSDDLADDESRSLAQRRAALAQWRSALERALRGPAGDSLLLRALADSVRRFDIPSKHLFALLDGVEKDVSDPRITTSRQLLTYCDQVASAVGRACLFIWGFQGPEPVEAATACGRAFQLTNILRDLAEDAQRNRVYLPQEELDRFGYAREELLRGEDNDRFRALLAFQFERAEHYYHAARSLGQTLSPEGRRMFEWMFATYSTLLQTIRQRQNEVLKRRIRLGTFRRLRLAAQVLLGMSPLPRSPLTSPTSPSAGEPPLPPSDPQADPSAGTQAAPSAAQRDALQADDTASDCAASDMNVSPQAEDPTPVRSPTPSK